MVCFGSTVDVKLDHCTSERPMKNNRNGNSAINATLPALMIVVTACTLPPQSAPRTLMVATKASSRIDPPTKIISLGAAGRFVAGSIGLAMRLNVSTIMIDNAPHDAGVPKKNSHQPNTKATGRP